MAEDMMLEEGHTVLEGVRNSDQLQEDTKAVGDTDVILDLQEEPVLQEGLVRLKSVIGPRSDLVLLEIRQPEQVFEATNGG